MADDGDKTEETPQPPDPAEAQEAAQKQRVKTAKQNQREVEKALEAEGDDNDFPVERLIDESTDLVGHPSHVVVGALEHAGLGSRKNLTIDEVREAVDDWLTTEVA